MSIISKVLSLENPAFCGYVTYSSLLVLKMMIMPLLTVKQRRKFGVPISPEDCAIYNRKSLRLHEEVERIRRAHLNDLENIPIFFIAGAFYLLTNPSPRTALNLFRTYTIARYCHTFVYAVVVIPQPARAISWSIGFAITGYMLFRTIRHFKAF
ncbi:hypothetical protein ILUMI_24570 [Ignelater luminosus]|uniref:Microsomal glutathione S-transferase 1 n=1 Tax=Ignelater luminosus TaxID=2038154 RepID=A0A8K0CAA5_IGNLU|nr:hypothetical protein ILUMI_24570 [Ignelater luminosus]